MNGDTIITVASWSAVGLAAGVFATAMARDVIRNRRALRVTFWHVTSVVALERYERALLDNHAHHAMADIDTRYASLCEATNTKDQE